MDDRELLAELRRGSGDALAALYDRYGATLFALARRLCATREDAEDAVQDVFLGLPRSVGSFRGHGSFEGWLKRVTARTALMITRRERRRAEVAPGDNEPAQGPKPSLPERIDLERAIATLPQKLRAVFVLKDIEGFSHDDVARLLEISTGASLVRLHRARKLLCQALGGYDE